MQKRCLKIFLFEITGIFIVVISLAVLNIFPQKHTINNVNYTSETGDHYYTDDYPQIYSETINAMFGNDCIVSSPKYQSNEIEKCCHTDSGTEFFTSWDVKYSDGNGNMQNFYFNNKMSFSHWIKEHANKMAEQLYADYYNNAFTDIPLRQSSELYAFCASLSCNRDEIPRMCEAADKYLESILTPENCIKFCELTEKNVFELMPVYMNAHIFIDTSSLTNSEIKLYREKAELGADLFLSVLNEFTNNTVNISFLIDDDVSKDTRKYYIKGKEIESDSFTFERDVFKSYEDKFYNK